jgi:hypothetical protein
MSNSIRLHHTHGLAPVLTFCRICGSDSEIALLGAGADKVMREVQKAMGQEERGYKGTTSDRIPSQNLCDTCQGILDGGGTIIMADDTKEYLRLASEQVDLLIGKIVDAKDRILDFNAVRGKVLTIPKAFWYAEGDNIRLRDPKEWTI